MNQNNKDLPYIKQVAKVFFLLGGGLTLLALLMGVIKPQDFLKTFIVNGFASIVFWFGNDFLASYLDSKFPWTGNTAVRVVATIITTVVYTFIAFVAVVWVWMLVNNSQHSLIENIRFRNFWGSLIITLIISLILHGNGFLKEWKLSLIEAEKLKKEQIAAKYEVLKNQVNPHFLFNSLNVLTTLVHKDADLAEQFIRQLSHNYRYVLDTREREVVSLSEEIQNLEAYIFLMKIRFGESLKANIPIATEGNIAPLTLQMLAENALKHNEVSKTHPLSIDVFLEGDYVVVKNNIQRRNNVADSTGVGLDNIRSRYTFLSEKQLVITEEVDFFTVKIPIIA